MDPSSGEEDFRVVIDGNTAHPGPPEPPPADGPEENWEGKMEKVAAYLQECLGASSAGVDPGQTYLRCVANCRHA